MADELEAVVAELRGLADSPRYTPSPTRLNDLADRILDAARSTRPEEHEAALAQEREKAQRWLDEDVKNMDAIERLESERDALEDALEPFVKAKPRPRAGSATDNSDRYELYVSGEMLRAAKAALAEESAA